MYAEVAAGGSGQIDGYLSALELIGMRAVPRWMTLQVVVWPAPDGCVLGLVVRVVGHVTAAVPYLHVGRKLTGCAVNGE